MRRILMIGTFLAKRTGTYSISEKVAHLLKSNELELVLVSGFQSKILRFLEIIVSCLFGRYDKVHIDTFSGNAFYITQYSSFLSSLRRKPIILTLHGGALPEFYQKNQQRVQKVFNRASKIYSPSLYLKDFFGKQGIEINYLPNPINLDRFKYNRELVIQYSLLWVRAFDRVYNPEIAIKTLYEVKKFFPEAGLTMVGPDKGLLGQMRALIDDLNLHAFVKITGPISNEDLFKFYQTHEVFLNTTSYESFGVAVVEAAACGVPVVSARVGEIPYLWKHEENMLMAESYAATAFATEVRRLFESRELATKISRNARKKAETFDWPSLKSKWTELLTLN